MYSCPVCGYGGLRQPPRDHVICPSCGTQFGYSDVGDRPLSQIYASLRAKWTNKRHAQWHSRRIPPPENWNGWLQLIQAGLIFATDIPWLQGMSMTTTTFESIPVSIPVPIIANNLDHVQPCLKLSVR